MGAVASAQAAVVVSKEFLDPASVNGSNLQDLSGQVTDATPAQGDLRTVRLGISHVGAAISGGQITDSLPTQIRLADPVNARFSSGCGPSAVVATGSPGGGAFIATGLQVPSGIDADPGRCFIYFDVVSTVVGTWNNVIAAGGFTGNAAGVGVISNPDPAPRSMTVTGLSRLSVSKGFAPSTLLMGATTTLTITVANPNTGRPVRLTQLTEELPETLAATSPTPSISCSAGGGGGGGGSGVQNVVVSNVPVLNQFPISKSFSPSALSAGGTSIVTLALVNNGLYALDNVAVDDALPSVVVGTVTAQLRVATPANTTTNCGGTPVFTISAERDRLQVGGITVPARAAGAQSGQCQVSFAVVAPVPATWNNSATATGTDARTGETVSPPGPANATLVTTPSLTATKSFSPTPVAANGGNSTVTVTLGNIGAAVLTNVSVNDPLPSGLRVASTPAAATTCAGPTAITANAGASSAQLAGATLPAGTTCTFTFNVVTQAAPNPVVNTIPAGSISAAGGVISTTPTSASLATFNGGGLNVEKQFSLTDLAGLGQPTRLTIRLSNTSTQALTGIAFTDTLPTGMVLTAAPNPTTTCGGTVNAQPDGTSIVFSGGTVAPGVGVLPAPAPATCVIAANVTLNRVGTLANTIPLNAVTTDQGLTNTNAAVANVTALATVGVTKRFTPQAVPPHTPALPTIAVLNNAGVDLTHLT
ncbi:MAG: hypothetical protein ACK58C_18510, partial [Betaproteobacteria bacterium]